MFTGIVQELGTVVAVERKQGLTRLRIHAPHTAPSVFPGESLAISGVCLTVVRTDRGILAFEIIPETVRLTNLGKLSVGARVNVERSLSLSDRLNGHLVLGHIDGVGKVTRYTRASGEVAVSIRVDRTLRNFLVPKGPIAVDGVSLTVGPQRSADTFSVFLIPETIHKTTLGVRRVGDLVNIEIDYFAKLIAQLLRTRVGQHA